MAVASAPAMAKLQRAVPLDHGFYLELLSEHPASDHTTQWRHSPSSPRNGRTPSRQTLPAESPCPLNSAQSTTSKVPSSSVLRSQVRLTCQVTRVLCGATLRDRGLGSLKTIARDWIPGCGSRSMVGGYRIVSVKSTGFARYATAAAARTSTGSSPSNQQRELAIT